MTYKETRELAEKELAEVINAGSMTEIEKEKMIFGFVQGFLSGEIHQIRRRMNKEAELYANNLINCIS